MKRIFVFFILIGIILLNTPLKTSAQSMDFDFSKLFDEHGSIMLLIDSQTGSIEYANKTAADFYGYTVKQLQEMNMSQINTLTSEEIENEMQAALNEHRNYFIFQHRTNSGEERIVEVYSYPYLYGDHKLLFSVIQDITTKTELEASHKMMRISLIFGLVLVILSLSILSNLLFKNLRAVKKKSDEINNFNELRKTFIDSDNRYIYLKDEHLKYVFVNKAMESFYHKEASDMIGLDDFDLSDAEFGEKIRKTDLDVLKQMKLLVDEVQWQNRIYKTKKFPIKMINGSYGVGAYIEDITQEYISKETRKKTLLRNLMLVDVFKHHFNSTQEQLDYVLNEALKLTGSKFGYIYLYDEEIQEFTINSWSKHVMKECEILEKQTKYKLEETGLWGEAVRQREPIFINDYKMPNDMKKGYPKGHVALLKFMTVPVIIEKKIVAVIGLANKQEDYDFNDIYQITALMNGVWNAKERREVQEKLIVERNKYFQTLRAIGDGVMVVDHMGKVEMLNKAAEMITGWTTKEALGKPYKEVFVLSHEKESFIINDPIEGVLKTGDIHVLSNSAVLTARDGTHYHLEDSAAPIKDDKNNIIGVVLVFRDVTEKKEQRRKIEYLSFHDSLTKLYNRRFFEDELRRIDLESNLPISLIMGDVNGLKLANDIFGHASGDLLLQKTARVLMKVCRASDIIARWGGDEFVVLLPKTKIEEAEAIVLEVKDEFAKEQIKAIRGSISMGCDTKTHINENILQILEKAEDKMYAQKTVERNKFKTSTIKAITEILHKNSPREKEHAQRVSELCQQIGRAMDLPEVDVKKLKEAGLLHDIGKITLENSLLNNTGTLSQQEKKEVKQHPVVGYRILNAFDETLDLAECILAHHERWDGKGYPKGLKETEIPVLARIIAIAESYDAIANSRLINQKAVSKEEALQEINKHAGSKFDPDILALFREIMLKGNIV